MDWGILLSSSCIGSLVVMGFSCSYQGQILLLCSLQAAAERLEQSYWAGHLTPRKEQQEILSQSQPLEFLQSCLC